MDEQCYEGDYVWLQLCFTSCLSQLSLPQSLILTFDPDCHYCQCNGVFILVQDDTQVKTSIFTARVLQSQAEVSVSHWVRIHLYTAFIITNSLKLPLTRLILHTLTDLYLFGLYMCPPPSDSSRQLSSHSPRELDILRPLCHFFWFQHAGWEKEAEQSCDTVSTPHTGTVTGELRFIIIIIFFFSIFFLRYFY